MALAVSPSTMPSEKGLNPNAPQGNPGATNINALGSQVIREIVIPELTKEVNENKNFAQLRQVYNSLILATWYKKKIKDSILAQVYADKNKVKGVEYSASVIARPPALTGLRPGGSKATKQSLSMNDVDSIYQRYLQAFKKGVYNYIKDTDMPNGISIPRKYFSGGLNMAMTSSNYGLKAAFEIVNDPAMISPSRFVDNSVLIEAQTNPINIKQDKAQTSKESLEGKTILRFSHSMKLTGGL